MATWAFGTSTVARLRRNGRRDIGTLPSMGTGEGEVMPLARDLDVYARNITRRTHVVLCSFGAGV